MADEKNLNEEELNEAVEDVTEAANDAAEDATEAVEDAAEAVTEEVEDVAEDAAEAVEDAAEAVEDAVEGAAEAAEGAADEATEAVEEMSEVDKAVAAALAERDAQDAKVKAAKLKKTKIIAAIAAAVVVIGGVICSGFVSKGYDGGIQFNTYDGWLPKLVNKYNHMGYVDVTGRTVGELANGYGITVADFLEENGLPDDMPGSTYEMVAIYMLPAKNFAAIQGLDFATLKQMLNVPDKTEDGRDITEDMLWIDVLGEVSFADYVGDTGDGERVEYYKEQFDLDDSITADTKWKEVRDAVDRAQMNLRLEEEKAANEPVEEPEADDTAADDAADDTAADDTAADDAADDTAADDTAADNAAADSAE